MGIMDKARTYVGVYSDTDIRARLQEDHKTFKELTKDACEGSTPASRANAFKKLKPLLVAHSRAEEAVVYVPLVKLRKGSEARDVGNEGFVEHTIVDMLLEHLSTTRPPGSADLWKARAKVLREMLEHHIDEEEKEVFEQLGAHFDDAELEEMAVDFEYRHAKLLGKKVGKAPGRKQADAVSASAVA